jgi:hypothetical protein
MTMNCSAQQSKHNLILNKIEIDHQLKLDSGKFMLETEREYSLRLDSLMKVVYNELRSTKKGKKYNIEIEQNKWSKKNELKIENIWKQTNEVIEENGFIANDEKMFAYKQQSELTRMRILELINKLKK